MKKYAIIVAGGSGTRMGAPIPKQYLEIAGMPILMHTINKFYKVDSKIAIILVIPSNDFDFWKELCEKFNFTTPHAIVKGGNSRFQSVKNGLSFIEDEFGLVAIHDGVRPFVNNSVILESFEGAAVHGSAIAVVALKDSLRKLTDDGKSFYQERQYFRMVQTPQTFQINQIKKAFDVTELQQFTDDATVFEHQGWQVHLISGNAENIKITTPEDIKFAEYLMNSLLD